MSMKTSFAMKTRLQRLSLLGLAVLTMLGQSQLSMAADAKPAGKPAEVTQADKAPVKVDGAWIRPAVQGQMATGGFMQLTAGQDLVLLGFSSKVANDAELHEMAMDGDVMRMRPISSLELPAGKTVALLPGRHHLMLMGLKQPLKVGDTVVLTLKLRTASGKQISQDITAEVRNGMMTHEMGHQGMGDGGMHGHMMEKAASHVH